MRNKKVYISNYIITTSNMSMISHNKSKKEVIMKASIKKRLATAIAESGYSLVDIAKSIGVTQSMLSQYMLYEKIPSLLTFAKLCKFLNVSADEILDLK